MTKQTALYDLHVAQGAKMVPFAGYSMPIQYKDGVIKEHEWVRSKAGIFDVSHMGQVMVEGEGAAEFFSYITPSNFLKTPHGRAKYTVLTNEQGGIIDDLIITRVHDTKFFVVINAACKEKDIAWMKKHLTGGLTLTALDDRSLIAVQGQQAQKVVSALLDTDLSSQAYMTFKTASFNGNEVFVSRLGYTGEDGFEISVSNADAPALWSALSDCDEIKPIGLGARDTLRLEMGYPLYGHDINDETSPIDADLGWVVPKQHLGFIGGVRILKEKEDGTATKRIGFKITDKGIAREGAEIYSTEGNKIGIVTSGGFSPTLGEAIGQGYVEAAFAQSGNSIKIRVRKNDLAATVANLPLVAPKTKSMKV